MFVLRSVFVIVVAACAFARGAVINGFPATSSQFPQLVEYGSCVGTLINDRWAISAAHCYRPYHTSVKVISIRTKDSKRRVLRSIVHPDYRLGDNLDDNGTRTEVWATYDYLLLEMQRPVRAARSLLTDAPEPPPGTRVAFPSFSTYDNTTLVGKKRPPFYQGELFTISDEECASKIKSFDPATMLCAESRAPSHSGACFGDSGSGLMAGGRLLGVLSWVQNDAVDCGPDRVVVAARLSSPRVRRWIADVTSGAPAADARAVVDDGLIQKAREALPDVIRVVRPEE